MGAERAPVPTFPLPGFPFLKLPAHGVFTLIFPAVCRLGKRLRATVSLSQDQNVWVPCEPPQALFLVSGLVADWPAGRLEAGRKAETTARVYLRVGEVSIEATGVRTALSYQKCVHPSDSVFRYVTMTWAET